MIFKTANYTKIDSYDVISNTKYDGSGYIFDIDPY